MGPSITHHDSKAWNAFCSIRISHSSNFRAAVANRLARAFWRISPMTMHSSRPSLRPSSKDIGASRSHRRTRASRSNFPSLYRRPKTTWSTSDATCESLSAASSQTESNCHLCASSRTDFHSSVCRRSKWPMRLGCRYQRRMSCTLSMDVGAHGGYRMERKRSMSMLRVPSRQMGLWSVDPSLQPVSGNDTRSRKTSESRWRKYL